MKCPRCQAVNQDDARFCDECGARLGLTCPSCGAPIVSGKKQMALPGTALMTASTLALAEGYVAVKPRGRAPVKGLAEPVEVFELAGIGVARTRLQAATIRGLTKFVGRDEEMARKDMQY